MASIENDDDMVRDVDEIMSEYDVEQSATESYETESEFTDENEEAQSSYIDFSDVRYDRRRGSTNDRRSNSYPDRRKRDRRRASRFPEGENNDSKGKTSIDPMNIYLREMGTLTLLSHDEELKLAKMMEDGKRRVQNAVLKTPLAVPALLEVVKGLDKNVDKITQIVSGITENKPSILKNIAKPFWRVSKRRLMSTNSALKR